MENHLNQHDLSVLDVHLEHEESAIGNDSKNSTLGKFKVKHLIDDAKA